MKEINNSNGTPEYSLEIILLFNTKECMVKHKICINTNEKEYVSISTSSIAIRRTL